MMMPNDVSLSMAQQDLIDYYRAIESSSLRMLEAAQEQDWDEVVRLEGACALLIEQLRFEARNRELDPAQRAEKMRIMQRILKNDSQIRYLAEPWLVHFEKKFDNLQQLLH